MKNAEKFQEIFKEFATEVWAFPEKDFLTWLNAEYEEPTTKDNSEVIAMLELLKAQAHNSGANTFIWDVTLESFNFVITRAIESLAQEPTTKNDVVPRKVVERIIKSPRTQEQMLSMLNSIQSVTPQEPCDKCEVGNPCLYCKHEFEPQESEEM